MESDNANTSAASPEIPWQHVHPISLLFVLLSKLRQWIIPVVVGLYSATQGGWIAGGLGALAVAALIAFSLIRFLTLKFRLAGGELQVREGLFFRSYRTVPANRIQNIDLVQNVFHRLFGVAEVRIETASGKEPEAVLQVLKLAEVEKLRASVFQQAQAQVPANFPATSAINTTEDDVDSQPAISAAPPTQSLLLGITLKQLALAGLCSNRGLLLVPITLGALYETRSFTNFKFQISEEQILERLSLGMSSLVTAMGLVAACILVFVLLKVFSFAWFVIRFYGYQLWAVGDDLRIGCGLLTKVSATIPRSRIQFISIHRSWLGRRLGLASIRIETAGGGGSEHENASQSVGRRWFVPVISESQVVSLVENLRPGIQWRESDFDWRPISPLAGRRLQRVAMIVAIAIAVVGAIVWPPWGATFGVLVLPILLWRANRQAKSMRYARAGSLVIFRSGLMTRKCSCTFIDKIQTVRLSSSPFDRRWNMATLVVDTAAAGPAEHRIAVRYLDATYANDEFGELNLAASGLT